MSVEGAQLDFAWLESATDDAEQSTPETAVLMEHIGF